MKVDNFTSWIVIHAKHLSKELLLALPYLPKSEEFQSLTFREIYLIPSECGGTDVVCVNYDRGAFILEREIERIDIEADKDAHRIPPSFIDVPQPSGVVRISGYFKIRLSEEADSVTITLFDYWDKGGENRSVQL